jgi:hypothetical protein
MQSSRRIAQLGLAAASLILFSSVAVLIVGGSEASSPAAAQSGNTSGTHSIAGIQAQLPQPVGSDKN